MEHLHNEILLSHKKGENFTLCDSMDRPEEHYAEVPSTLNAWTRLSSQQAYAMGTVLPKRKQRHRVVR